MMKKIFYLFLIFILIPCCLYLALNRESINVDEFRKNSGYKEVDLSDGITAYKDIGDKSNEVIVLVHGATFGSLAYEEYVNVFLENGYRVISYDQYGRGYSDRVDNNVSIELMEKQLKELIEYCEVENVILYGVSFGAAVVAKYASNNLKNINSDASLDMQVRHLAISSDNSNNIATTVYFGVNTSSPSQSKKAEPPYGAIFARKGVDLSFKRIGLAPINVNGFGIIRMNQLGDKVVVSERGFSGGRSPNLEHDNINRFKIDSSNNDHGGRIYTTQPF